MTTIAQRITLSETRPDLLRERATEADLLAPCGAPLNPAAGAEGNALPADRCGDYDCEVCYPTTRALQTAASGNVPCGVCGKALPMFHSSTSCPDCEVPEDECDDDDDDDDRPVSLPKAAPSPLERIYPDTAGGALAMLADSSNLDLTGASCVADPEIRGVWAVTLASGSVAIAYLAGYAGPWGDLRSWNDFECDESAEARCS